MPSEQAKMTNFIDQMRLATLATDRVALIADLAKGTEQRRFHQMAIDRDRKVQGSWDWAKECRHDRRLSASRV